MQVTFQAPTRLSMRIRITAQNPLTD